MELKRFLESDALTELLEALKADQPPLADLPVSSAPPDAHRANLALMVKAFETHMPEALLGGGSDPQAKASFWLAVNDRSPQTPLFLSRKASSESYQCVHDCWYTVFSRRLSNVRDRELKRKKRVEKMAQPALLPRAAEPPMASQEVVLMRQRCARMGTRVEELNERVDELETELSQAVEHVRDFSARLGLPPDLVEHLQVTPTFESSGDFWGESGDIREVTSSAFASPSSASVRCCA
jgi:hypothetical protein